MKKHKSIQKKNANSNVFTSNSAFISSMNPQRKAQDNLLEISNQDQLKYQMDFFPKEVENKFTLEMKETSNIMEKQSYTRKPSLNINININKSLRRIAQTSNSTRKSLVKILNQNYYKKAQDKLDKEGYMQGNQIVENIEKKMRYQQVPLKTTRFIVIGSCQNNLTGLPVYKNQFFAPPKQFNHIEELTSPRSARQNIRQLSLNRKMRPQGIYQISESKIFQQKLSKKQNSSESLKLYCRLRDILNYRKSSRISSMSRN